MKFNIDGRDMGSVVKDAIATVSRSAAARRTLLRLGRRIQNQRRAVARLKLVVPMACDGFGLLYAAMNSGRSSLAILDRPFVLTGGLFALLVAGVALR